MVRRGVLVTFAVLFLAGGALAFDPDTRTGINAELREEWVCAVRAYERAVEKAPGDALRKRRLQIARKRGARVWAAEAEACADGKSWRRAAEAVAIFRIVNPDSKRLDRIAKRIENAGAKIPSILPDLSPANALFPRRSYEGRAACMARLGPVRVRANDTIEGLLSFLVRSQEEDGHWDLTKYGGRRQYSVGIDALALLALAAEGPVGLAGSRGRAMKRTADRIVKAQDPDGCFGPRTDAHFIYVHAIATRALAEYGHICRRTQPHESALTKAAGFLAKAQSENGGWRYGVAPKDSDNSVTYWCVAAIERLNELKFGLDEEVLQRAHAFAMSAVDPRFGRGGYVARGTGSARPSDLIEKFPPDRTEAMTAAAVMIRCMTTSQADLIESHSMRLITECLPDGVIPDMYYWHLGAEAFVRMTGTVPADWYQSLLNSVEKNVRADGSVGAKGPWGVDGGRIYATSVSVLALMAPFADFRSMPIIKREDGATTYLVRPGGGPTGINLDAGQELVVEPEGEVKFHPDDTPHGPAGWKKAPKKRERLSRSGPYGCLLGWVGPKGKPIAIKKKMTFRARECGQFYLAGNAENCGRAGGAFLVTISRAGD